MISKEALDNQELLHLKASPPLRLSEKFYLCGRLQNAPT